MPQIIMFGDIIEENGKTLRENNNAKEHKIELGTLVSVDVEQYYEGSYGSVVNMKGPCKLFVVSHDRDCDGTPLYSLSSSPIVPPASVVNRMKYEGIVFLYLTGYPEESLTPLSIKQELTTYEDYVRSLFGGAFSG